MSDYTHWIWFAEACGPGSSLPDILLPQFKYNVTDIYNADMTALEEILPNNQRSRLRFFANKDLTEASEIFEYCKRNGIGILPANAKSYFPPQLRRIKTKPALLYYRGTPIDFDNNLCIAMVGTRSMTEYGSRLAYTLAYDITKCGAVVVSGMALGIDGKCHQGALDAGGRTIAVLGCGLDRAYPGEHLDLMNHIIRRGMVVSEYKPFTPPYHYNFPTRNRIISGISQGCVVIEADSKSGALITANNAQKQGRRIFAVPGKAGESKSEGTNTLIKNGAIMAESAFDVIHPFRDEFDGIITEPPGSTLHRINNASEVVGSYIGRETTLADLIKNDRERRAIERKASKADEHYYESERSSGRATPPSTTMPLSRSKKAPFRPMSNAAPKEFTDVTDDIAPENLVTIELPEASKPKETENEPTHRMDEFEIKILSMLSLSEPTSIEQVIASGIPVSKAMISMTKLEISGYVKNIGANQYLKIN